MLVLLLAAATPDADPFAHYRELTAAEPRCQRSADTTDVTVCGLREADRFRVPFVIHDAGDPLHEAVMDERRRYLAPTDNCREKSAFLVGCGSAGLRVMIGGGREGVEVRPLAK